jgi:dCTP deaminase
MCFRGWPLVAPGIQHPSRNGVARCPGPRIDCAAVVLSDRSIGEELERGGIVIDPLGEGCIQPSSVDLHVDRYFRVFRNDTTPFIDPKQAQEDLTELVEVGDGEAFILHPGEFVLGSTLERVGLGNDLVARLEGKSSLGRLGLLIHSTAGFVDAGWDGHLTLELSNVANLPIAIYPGMKIGQISFLRMSTEADHPYGSDETASKYRGQEGPTPSRYYLNFDERERRPPG